MRNRWFVSREEGCYDDIADASAADEKAKAEFGYHPNHGSARKAA
jgi:hypothetical protein